MCCEYGLQPQLVLPLSPKSTFCIAARLTTSPPCLKSFGDSPFFTEQNLEPLTSIQSPWASGPAISHSSWLYLDTPAAPKSAWFQLSSHGQHPGRPVRPARHYQGRGSSPAAGLPCPLGLRGAEVRGGLDRSLSGVRVVGQGSGRLSLGQLVPGRAQADF